MKNGCFGSHLLVCIDVFFGLSVLLGNRSAHCIFRQDAFGEVTAKLHDILRYPLRVERLMARDVQ